MPDLTYRERRAAGARGGGQTINRSFRLAGMETLRAGQVRLHLTAIGANGIVDPDIDRAYVIVTEDALERILDAFEGLRRGTRTPPASVGTADAENPAAPRSSLTNGDGSLER